MSFETDLYTVISIRRLELKLNTTQLEIDDTRFLSCLLVVPLAMEATLITVAKVTKCVGTGDY